MAIHSGIDTIKLLGELFDLGDMPITRITLDASVDCITILNVEGLAQQRDIEVSKSESIADISSNTSKYEINIKKIEG
jgi:hypothetical protein